jgi:peptidylprolyl isomerase
MKRSTVIAGLSAVALVVGASILGLRSGGETIAATQPASATTAPLNVVARLGDQVVSPEEIKAMIAALPPTTREQLRGNRPALESWIRSRLAEKAVLEQASAQGWPERPEIQQQTRAAVDQIVFRNYLASVSQVPADYPSDQELQQAYQANQASLQVPARYRLSQIFLAVNDAASLDAARKQAQELSKRAQAPNADFAALARQYSQDPESAKRGSDSGLQPLQQFLGPIRDTIGKLKVGAVTEPLQSPAGFHILKLTEQQPARVATLDESRDRLTTLLRSQRQEQIAKAYLEGTFKTATLSIDGSVLNQVLESSVQ